jgi:hypothetical protein
MDVYGSILEYSNVCQKYVRFLEGTIMYLEGIRMYIKTQQCIFSDK